MKLLILFLFLLNFTAMAETRDFPIGNFKLLQIENPKGEIAIKGVKNSKISVNVEKVQFDPKCQLKFSEEGTKLSIIVDQENMIFDKANCITKIKLNVPNELDVKITTGTAKTLIDNIWGSINFKSATGNLIATNMQSHFSGTSATGSMNLKYSKCPNRADIDILTASSDAEISFPIPCKIKVSHKSAAGELFNEIGESSDYKVLINVKSASGNLKILGIKH